MPLYNNIENDTSQIFRNDFKYCLHDPLDHLGRAWDELQAYFSGEFGGVTAGAASPDISVDCLPFEEYSLICHSGYGIL